MALGRAKLAIGKGISVWVLEALDGFGDAQVHSHHAIQVTVCLSGELALYDHQSAVRGRLLAVDTDVPHRFEAYGLLVFIFIEPESSIGKALRGKLFLGSPLAQIDAPELPGIAAQLANAFAENFEKAHLVGVGQQIVEALAPAERLTGVDERISRIAERASTHLDTSLASAAQAVGVHLSLSRLRHLFVEETGLAYKTYLLWMRLIRALEIYASGASLTQAAHAAGFADSAHFSRTFKRTFGLPATTLERL